MTTAKLPCELCLCVCVQFILLIDFYFYLCSFILFFLSLLSSIATVNTSYFERGKEGWKTRETSFMLVSFILSLLQLSPSATEASWSIDTQKYNSTYAIANCLLMILAIACNCKIISFSLRVKIDVKILN